MSRRDIRTALLGEHAAVLLPLLAAGAVVGALATQGRRAPAHPLRHRRGTGPRRFGSLAVGRRGRPAHRCWWPGPGWRSRCGRPCRPAGPTPTSAGRVMRRAACAAASPCTGPASAAGPAPIPARSCWSPGSSHRHHPAGRHRAAADAKHRRRRRPGRVPPGRLRRRRPGACPLGLDDYGLTGGRIRHLAPRRGRRRLPRPRRGRARPGPEIGAPAAGHHRLQHLAGAHRRQRAAPLPARIPGEPTAGPAVTWIAGGPPRAAVPAAEADLEIPLNGPPWPVQVGLSEAEAAALGVRPGRRSRSRTSRRNEYNVRVSGIFRPVDANDPAWRLTPWVLHPVAGAGRAGQHPARRPALPRFAAGRPAGLPGRPASPYGLVRPRPGRAHLGLGPGPRRDRGRAQGHVRARPPSATTRSRGRRSSTACCATSGTRSTAATAQASVLLIAVLAAAVLVLLLAADLLARRRAPALIAARQRGASLPDLAAELLHRVRRGDAAGRRAGARAGFRPRRRRRTRVGHPGRRSVPSSPARRSGRSPRPGPPAIGVRRPTARPAAGRSAPGHSGVPPLDARGPAPRRRAPLVALRQRGVGLGRRRRAAGERARPGRHRRRRSCSCG